MDAIPTYMTAFTQIEEAALGRHEADYQTNLRNLLSLVVGVSVLALCAALSFAYLLFRQGLQLQEQ
jgi:hypothetical protein